MPQTMTVGDLKRHLLGMNDDTEISFAGDLTFYRFKRWNDNEFVLEFNEAEAATSESFHRRHPNIKVCFCHLGKFENL